LTYDSPIEPEVIIKEICNIKQQFSQYGGARPFGVSLMVAGMQNKKGSLYVSDVTGNYFQYHANAIGENDEKIRIKLREKYKKDFTLKKGIKLAIEIFKEVKNNFDAEKYELVYIEEKDEKIIRLEGKEIEELK
jgi:proteasome alpha subunit